MLWAISFVSPAILGGFAFASVPLLIHLLHRQRYREVEWAAVEWLLAAIRKNARRLRLEQWLLLLLRTLLLLLLVLAMAGPSWDRDTAPGAAVLPVRDPNSHSIFLLDHSLSMQYQVGNQTRWQRAVTLVQEILDEAPKGDLASLILLEESPKVLVAEPSPYLEEIVRECEQALPYDGMAQLEPALPLVAQLLQAAPTERQRIFLITDQQRLLYETDAAANSKRRSTSQSGQRAENGSPTGFQTFAQKLAELSETVEWTILDVAGETGQNAVVEEIVLPNPLLVVDQPTLIQVTVANYGRQDLVGSQLDLIIQDQVEGSQRIDVPAGDRQRFTFPVTLLSPGQKLVQARLAADALPTDNRCWATVEVRAALDVLLVDGQTGTGPLAAETDYLRVALNAQSNGAINPVAALATSASKSPFRVQVVREGEVWQMELPDWDLVALCNVGSLTESEVKRYERYVRQGGALLIFAGDQVQVPIYNRLLHRDGTGLLPVPIQEIRRAEPSAEEFFGFDPQEYRHPIIREFQAHERAGLLTTKIFRYLQLAAPSTNFVANQPDRPLEIVMRYQTGDPAILLAPWASNRTTPSAKPENRAATSPGVELDTAVVYVSAENPLTSGWVGWVTTTADLDWNLWGTNPSYLPVMQELVRYLIAPNQRERGTNRVGDPVTLIWSDPALGSTAQLQRPEPYTEQPVTPRQTDGLFTLTVPETPRIGVYRLAWPAVQADLAAARRGLFTVAAIPAESQLTHISAEELQQLFPRWRFRTLDHWSPETAAKLDRELRTTWSLGLLYATLGLLFLETFLAWRFGHHAN